MSANPQTQLEQKYQELEALTKEFNTLCRESGALDVQDYELTGCDGQPVRLSQAFGEHEQLVLIHNMGFACKYCTLWADGFNGIWKHFESGQYGKRAKFLLVSNDTPKQQKAGAELRGWTLPMLSCQGTTLFADLGYVGDKPDAWQPGVSTLEKLPDGSLRRIATAPFGPGDMFCSLWHFFDLLK
jgi:peroxiredoxin